MSEKAKQLATVFAVTDEEWSLGGDGHPYRDTKSMWEDHLQAYEALRTYFGNQSKMKIVLRSLTVLNNGRVTWEDLKTIYENNEWVSLDHDPRAADPQYREYLKLKEIYGD